MEHESYSQQLWSYTVITTEKELYIKHACLRYCSYRRKTQRLLPQKGYYTQKGYYQQNQWIDEVHALHAGYCVFNFVEISSSVVEASLPLLCMTTHLDITTYMSLKWMHESTKRETERGKKWTKTEYKNSISSTKRSIIQCLLCQNQRCYLWRIQVFKFIKWFIPILLQLYNRWERCSLCRKRHFKTCLISIWWGACDQGKCIFDCTNKNHPETSKEKQI